MDDKLEKVSKDSKFLFTLLVWYKLCIINNVSIPNESQSHSMGGGGGGTVMLEAI